LKNILLYIALVILTFSNISAQYIDVLADTDTSEYFVGDYIEYSLELKYDKQLNVTIPSVPDSISNLEFIREETPLREENETQVIERRRYIFSKYDSTEVTLPSFKIPYTVAGGNEVKYAMVNPVDIVVKTMEVDPQGEIQDVKAPLRIQLDLLFILLIVLVVIILGAAGYFIYRHYKKKRSGEIHEKKIIKIPAYKIALESLSELESKKLWQQGRVKDYHSEITEIVRRYFEKRFNFLAMEMTSAEVLESLNDIKVNTDVNFLTNDFLANADMVKFAKFVPMPTINEEMMKQAYAIVNKTKQEEEVKVVTEVENAG